MKTFIIVVCTFKNSLLTLTLHLFLSDTVFKSATNARLSRKHPSVREQSVFIFRPL